MKLYVDGALQGTNPQTGAQDYAGYWRIAGDNVWNGTDPFFSGTLDEVAVYPTPLTDAQVENHWELGTGVVPNVAPTASFTGSAVDLHAQFDASASADQDGTIASYAWDFGDGTTGTGATPTHDYTTAGTHTVTLTVTDNRGATATTTGSIEEDLLQDGLLLRYRTTSGVDGLPGDEHPFLACSFWLVQQYASSGRLDDARELMDRLLSFRNDLGLLSEEYDVQQARQVGNTPQALSHLTLVRAADAIAAATPSSPRTVTRP